MLAALAEAVQAHGGRSVAVVAHGGTLDVVYRAAQRLAWDAPRKHVMINAAINRMHARALPLELELVAWGDVAHLADDGAARDDSHA